MRDRTLAMVPFSSSNSPRARIEICLVCLAVAGTPDAAAQSAEQHPPRESEQHGTAPDGQNGETPYATASPPPRRPGTSGVSGQASVLALTIAGGVSLGSYEAGQTHFLTQALVRSSGSAKLMIATGASAGSVNSLIAVTQACLPPVSAVESSLGYGLWVDVGFDQLFDPGRATATSVFTQEPLKERFAKLEEVWNRGVPADCEFVVSMSAARIGGLEVQLAEGLVVPRQMEHFVVRGRGRQDGPPVFDNFVDVTRSFERPLLPLSSGKPGAARRDAYAIRQAVLASAAFPGGFPPVEVPHCVTPPLPSNALSNPPPARSTASCVVPTRVDRFVDGSYFDNTALSSAYRIARDGLTEEAGVPTFRAAPRYQTEAKPEVVYGFIDPSMRSYPIFQEDRTDRSDAPLRDLVQRLGGQAMTATRGYELAALAESGPRGLQRLWPIEANYPPISDLILAFFGFFERDFRDFDFHLGMYDALVALRKDAGRAIGVLPYLEDLERVFQGPLSEVPKRDHKLGCMLAHFEPDVHARLAPLCDGEDKRDFRALLQVTIHRLWSNCRRVDARQLEGSRHRQCRRANRGAEAPLVDASFARADARYKMQGESEFDYVMRLLATYGFHFEDLGLSRSQGRHGRMAVRRKLIDVVQSMAAAQPDFIQRSMVLSGGRTLVNTIAYEPPRRRGYAMLGTSVALGYLGRIAASSAWYWNADARLYNFRALMTNRPTPVAGALTVGPEFALLGLSNPMVQSSLALRGGYQFSSEDGIGFDPCTGNTMPFDSRNCSQPLIHLSANLSLMERVRLSVTPVFYPVPEASGTEGVAHNWFDLELTLGVEIY